MENAVKNGMLGILAAMDEECAPVLKRMKLAEEGKMGNALYWKGTFGGTEIVLVRCGVGRIKAAAAVAEMCRRFSVRLVLSIGTCGGLDPELQVGDVILAYRVAVPSASSGADASREADEPGCAAGADCAGDAICRAYEKVCQLEHKFVCRMGTILTVDKALATEESKALARKDYGADVVDMETSAIAKAAAECGVAWAVVRVVSDSASENLPIDFGSIMGADGEPDRVRLAVKAIMKPPLMLKLLKLRTAMNRAVGNMADCLEELAVEL